MSYIAPGTRDDLPNGPSAVAYTDEARAQNELERLSQRLDWLSQRHYPRCSQAEVLRLIERTCASITEMEQHAGGYRA